MVLLSSKRITPTVGERSDVIDGTFTVSDSPNLNCIVLNRIGLAVVSYHIVQNIQTNLAEKKPNENMVRKMRRESFNHMFSVCLSIATKLSPRTILIIDI